MSNVPLSSSSCNARILDEVIAAIMARRRSGEPYCPTPYEVLKEIWMQQGGDADGVLAKWSSMARRIRNMERDTSFSIEEVKESMVRVLEKEVKPSVDRQKSGNILLTGQRRTVHGVLNLNQFRKTRRSELVSGNVLIGKIKP